MEKIKIKHFVNASPGKKFLNYHQLSPQEMQSIRYRLAQSMGANLDITPKELVSIIDSREICYYGMNANNNEFLIADIASKLGISPKESVYINWHQFDEIDEIDYVSLDQYFEYIWYPIVDDIDIFDSTFCWILTISHDGNLKFLKISI